MPVHASAPTVGDLFAALNRVEGCKPPHVSVPKPGPCKGAKKKAAKTIGDAVKKAAKATPAAKKTTPAKTKATSPAAHEPPPGSSARMWTPPAEYQPALDELARLTKAKYELEPDSAKYDAIQKKIKDLNFTLPEKVVTYGAHTRMIDLQLDDFRRTLRGNTSMEELKPKLEAELRRLFKDKPIVTRVTDQNLSQILRDGRFRTQHEGVQPSEGVLKSKAARADAEALWFGIPEESDPKKRPVYGYVAVDGIGEPSKEQRLDQYGRVRVVLKDNVRKRTTVSMGDSLNNKWRVLPSPIENPNYRSYNGTLNRDGKIRYTPSSFANVDYAEAQIHDGVSVSDIAEVVFENEPSAALSAQLAASGVPWRIIERDTREE